MRRRLLGVVVILLTVLLTSSACLGAWEAEVVGPGGMSRVVDRRVLEKLTLDDRETEVALEYVLYAAGYDLVDTVRFVSAGEGVWSVVWEEAAAGAWWGLDGRLRIGEELSRVDRVEVEPLMPPAPVTAHITDIAPTVAAALGLRAPAEATGKVLDAGPADYAVLLFLDGFGYLRYTEVRDAGLIPGNRLVK